MLIFLNSSIEEFIDIIIVEAHSSILSADSQSQYRDLHTLYGHNTENSKNIFPAKELRGLSPNFHIHVSVSVPTIGLPILLQTRECGNWDRCRAIPFLGILKWDFCCSVGVQDGHEPRAWCTVYSRRSTYWATPHPPLSYDEPFFHHRGLTYKIIVLEIDIYPSTRSNGLYFILSKEAGSALYCPAKTAPYETVYRCCFMATGSCLLGFFEKFDS
jgi:hypothetical protein